MGEEENVGEGLYRKWSSTEALWPTRSHHEARCLAVRERETSEVGRNEPQKMSQGKQSWILPSASVIKYKIEY